MSAGVLRDSVDEAALTGKTVLVTGATGAIGGAVTRALAKHRATVVALGRDIGKLREIERELTQEGCNVIGLTADVTRWSNVVRAITKIRSQVGSIQMVYNAIGITRDGPLIALKPADIKRVVDTNLLGTAYICKAILPDMITQRWGRIVNTVSQLSVGSRPGVTAYCMSKIGVLALSRCLAAETAQLDILINCHDPGSVRSTLNPGGAHEASAAVPTALRLLTLPSDGPRGRIFRALQETSWWPE